MFEHIMNCPSIAKSRLVSEILAAMKSGEESMSLEKVDWATKEMLKLASFSVATSVLSTKKEETAQVLFLSCLDGAIEDEVAEIGAAENEVVMV